MAPRIGVINTSNSGGISSRTLLFALPAIYLLIALLSFGQNRAGVGPTAFSVVPQRVLYVNQPAQPQVVVVHQAPQQQRPAAPATEAGAPPKPTDAPLQKVTYYDGNSVEVYPYAFSGTGTESWWHNVDRGWEEDSLYSLKAMLLKRPGATYIDFGSWIGPTVLFSAPYAAKVYALEPDPRAYQNVYHNVKANPHIAGKTTVLNLCISNSTGSLKMHAGEKGDSMSTISIVNDVNKDKQPNREEWDVRCTTLDAFVKENNIDPSNLVLKIDTEGAEKDILIQLRPWIAQYKPSMLLSFHAFTYPDDNEAHRILKEIVVSYKTAMLPKGEVLDRNGFSVGGWCRLCAMLLSDDEITPQEVTPVKKPKKL